MNLPTEIITTATLGTSQRPLSQFSTENPLLDDLLTSLKPEEKLLTATAVLAIQQRAGWLPEKDTRSLPEPAPKDETKPVGARAVRHLMVMLKNHYWEALPEWLTEMAKAGKHVPEESLPLLLDAGRTRHQYRKLILPVLGNRGRWLVEQVKDKQWNWFIVGDPETLWQEGTLEDRLLVLENLRKTDPARARELFLEVRAQEKSELLARFLRLFIEGLSMEDEPLLEGLLDNAELRPVVVDFLVRLPESRYIQRMWNRLSPLASLRNGAFELEPLQYEESMVRDDIQKELPPYRTDIKEEIVWWTYQIMHRIPPHFWCEKWNITPHQLIDALIRSKWKKYLVSMWSATIMVGNQINSEFAKEMLDASSLDEEGLLFSTIISNNIIFRTNPSLLTYEEIEARGLNILKNEKKTIRDHDVIVFLLAMGPRWSPEVTRLFLKLAHNYLSKGNVRPDEKLRNDFLRYALLMAPDMKDAIIKVLDVPTSAEKVWGETVDEIRLLLEFRQEMLEAIWEDA